MKKWFHAMQGLFQQLSIYGDQSSGYMLVLSSETVCNFMTFINIDLGTCNL